MSAVVTGLGVAAPIGLGPDAYWGALLAGRHGIRRVTRFDVDPYPSSLAGEIPDFDPAAAVPLKLMAQTDPVTRFAIAAADWALHDSSVDLTSVDEFKRGVSASTAAGGFEFGHNELEKLWSLGPKHVSAFQSFAWFYAVNTGQLCIRHDMRGWSTSLVSGQAGGLDALGQARRSIRGGQEVVLSGGFDSRLCPWGWVATLADGAVSRSRDSTRAYLPFDPDAGGYVPGEGGALLVVEDLERAREREARIYGELAGYAASFDPAPGSERPSTLERAIRTALGDARIDAADVDVVFADGAGIRAADAAEADALAVVFGPRSVPVTVPKAATGRLEAGGAPLDVAAALLAVRDGVIPPTVHTRPAPESPIDLVTTVRSQPVRTALVLARGRGGFNSALVVRSVA